MVNQPIVQLMRFIAVFSQKQTPLGLGFDSLVEATDFLFLGFEDQDLTPQGIYDSFSDQVMPYTHAGQRVQPVEEFAIRRVARAYLTRFNQWRDVVQPDMG